jgi:hypothetical protein
MIANQEDQGTENAKNTFHRFVTTLPPISLWGPLGPTHSLGKMSPELGSLGTNSADGNG